MSLKEKVRNIMHRQVPKEKFVLVAVCMFVAAVGLTVVVDMLIKALIGG